MNTQAATIRYTGRVATWFDEPSFGFIRPAADRSPDIFFSGRSLARESGWPVEGARVTYEIGVDKTNRPVAVNVQIED
jgi:cold shock CspA family protein